MKQGRTQIYMGGRTRTACLTSLLHPTLGESILLFNVKLVQKWLALVLVGSYATDRSISTLELAFRVSIRMHLALRRT